jgi:hypothetical protein
LINAGQLDGRYRGQIGCYNYTVVPTEQGYTATASRANRTFVGWDYYTAEDQIIRYSADRDSAPQGLAGQPAN